MVGPRAPDWLRRMSPEERAARERRMEEEDRIIEARAKEIEAELKPKFEGEFEEYGYPLKKVSRKIASGKYRINRHQKPFDGLAALEEEVRAG